MFLKFLLGLIIIAAIGYFGVSFYIANKLSLPTPSPLKDSATIISPNFENVAFTTQDNFHLKGWLFKNSSKKLVMIVGGFSNNRVNKDYDAVDISKELLAKGYAVLLFDRRTTGESDGNRVTFGLPERYDVIAAVEFAKSKGYKPSHIAIIADSLGAIATIMGVDELKDVGAMVSDSAAAEVKPIVAHLLTTEQHIPSFLNFGIFLMAKLFFHIDLDKIRPIDKIALYPKPILFLHGGADRTISPDNSQRLVAKATPGSKLVLFDKAEHAATYKTNPVLYRKEVFGFIDTHLEK